VDQRPVDATTGPPQADATEVVEAPPPITPVPDTAMSSLPEAPATDAGRNRARWLLGGGIAIAALAGLLLIASFLGARPLPEALKYVPADSAAVIELRPDLPGDQRQHLGNFLAHFPGFEDQSTLDTKLDEVFDRIIHDGSGGAVDYRTQIKPLLNGALAMSVDTDTIAGLMRGDTPSGFLLVATTDGSATCDTVFKATRAGEDHRGVEIRTVDDSLSISCAVHASRYVLIGPADAIKDGLDARLDGTGVDADATYKAARARLEGDQIASFFLDGDALVDIIDDMAESLGSALPEMPTIPEGTWVIEGVRVTDDALVLDAYGPPPPTSGRASGAPTTAPATESRFASQLPSDTLAYLEFHGFGALVAQGLASMRADPAQAEALASIDQALSILGGADNIVGWIEEIGVAVVPSDDAVGGALLIRGTDADAAAGRVVQIRNLLVLASTGTDITIQDSDHNGVTVTTVDLGDLGALTGGLGLPAGEVPDARITFSFAARDDLVILAVGDGVMERILDVESGTSLATSATYSRAISVAGAVNDLQVYVAVDGAMGFVEDLLTAEKLDMFSTELKPYLDHLAGVAATSTSTSAGTHSRVVFTVK
jgi:hypothetical protein